MYVSGRVARRHRCRPAPSERIVRVSPQYAQAFQTPTWADAAPQPTIVAAPARSSLQVMHVAGFTAERRLAPAALWTASSSRRIPVFASSSKGLVPKDHAEVSAGCPEPERRHSDSASEPCMRVSNSHGSSTTWRLSYAPLLDARFL